MTNFKQDLKNFNKFEHLSNKYSLDRQPSKRFSFVDKGKLWAKQLIKTHGFSNFPFFTAHKSFDSCDSGIDENSFSTNISKISTSSTCSFFTNIQSDSTYTTYLSNSNSLFSPIDESGYLVPIINYSLHKQTVKNAVRKASNSHLIRSFSTRSAYTSAHHNMMNNDRILNNRATICDQIRINREEQDCCIKCNTKLNITKKRMSTFSSKQEMEEDLFKTNQSYSLFESFTCDSCLQTLADKLKVPQNRAPNPPPLKNLPDKPAPPLPTQPPPSLHKITPILVQNNQILNCTCCMKFDFNKIRSSTPETESYLTNNTLNISNNISKYEPILYIDSQEELDSTIKSLFGRTKMRKSKKNQKKCDIKSKSSKKDDLHHNYHFIDEDQYYKKFTEFGQSLEFININNHNNMDSKYVKYEPSWEDSTINLLNDLEENMYTSSNGSSLKENKSKSYPIRINDFNTRRSSDSLQFKTSHQMNIGEDIERLLSDSSSDNYNKTKTDNSINSFPSKDSLCDVESASEPWCQLNMSRENVQDYLIDQEIGSFVIRLSTTCKKCYALSIRVPYFANQNGVAHYLIIKNLNGYKLKGVEKEFKNLKSLVTHYSVMQEILPVTLNLSNYSYIKSAFQVLNNSYYSLLKKPNFFMNHHHNIKNFSGLIK